MMKEKLFEIIHQDDRIIAVNKASGVSVGGDRWDESKLRLDQLLGEKVFTVHRIDRDTSGLVIFARDPGAHRALSQAFESRRVKKTYIAAIYGRPAWKETSCDLSLVPNGDKQHRTIPDAFRGKKSFTAFRVVGAAGNYAVVEANPETGRTHQIRAHLASLGHPVVCDALYGRPPERGGTPGIYLSSFKKNWRGDPLTERPLINRLALHALSLRLPALPPNPEGEELFFQAPLPRDMAALISQMEKQGGFSLGEDPEEAD